MVGVGRLGGVRMLDGMRKLGGVRKWVEWSGWVVCGSLKWGCWMELCVG